MINQIIHSHELLLFLATVPCIIALVENRKNEFFLFSISYLAGYLSGSLIKVMTAINRPFVNNPDLLRLTFNIPDSFALPSLHTVLITIFAWALSTIKPKLSVAGFTIAFIISVSRVYLGVHYYFDILSGFLLGTFVFWFTYSLLNPDKILSKYANPNIRRKIFHLIFGLTLAGLIYLEFVSKNELSVLVAGSGLFVLVSHFKKENKINRLVSYFERNPHPEYFGIGPLFFLISGLITTFIFSKSIATAAIINLAIGDSINALVGHFSFEPIKHGETADIIYGKKKLQPAIAAAISTIIINLYLVSPIQAVIGALVTFLLEFSSPKINGTEIDDNLLIPIASALTMSLSP